MKSYQQLQEDIDQRRAALAQKAKERTSDYTDDSRKEMDRNRQSSSSSGSDNNVSAGQGSTLKDKLGDAINKDIARAARGIRKAPGKIAKSLSKEKGEVQKKNEVKRAPFKPKRASVGVPFQPKTSAAEDPLKKAAPNVKEPTNLLENLLFLKRM